MGTSPVGFAGAAADEEVATNVAGRDFLGPETSVEQKWNSFVRLAVRAESTGSMFTSIKLVVFALLLSGGRFRLIAALLLLSLTKEGSSTYRYSCSSEHQAT
jgi:hypothetical protein